MLQTAKTIRNTAQEIESHESSLTLTEHNFTLDIWNAALSRRCKCSGKVTCVYLPSPICNGTTIQCLLFHSDNSIFMFSFFSPNEGILCSSIMFRVGVMQICKSILILSFMYHRCSYSLWELEKWERALLGTLWKGAD